MKMEALQQENAEPNQEKNDKTANQNDSFCETSTTKSIGETLNSTNIDNNLAIANDANPKKSINKTVYALLHRPPSPSRKNQIGALKSKYEKSDNEKETNDNSDKETTNEKEIIKTKSKLPLPIPRSSVKSEIIPNKLSDKLIKQRHSLMLDKKTKKTDENSNDVFRRKSSSSSGEFITIIPRSESVETVDQLGKELDLFTMDKKVKEKKRTSSFRKIFSGKIFNKEKKKKDETEKIIVQTDNMQNENSFSKQSTHRNSHIPKPYQQERRVPPPNIDMHEIEKRYAEMRVKEFHSIKQNFDQQNNHRDETDEILTVTPGPMDFDRVTNIKKFIDTSSSASVESEKDSTIKTFVDQEIPYRSTRFMENHRDTPPRLQELRQSQDVRLVNPKALIPINSERPLPNPYQKPAISPKPQLAPVQNSPKPNIRQQFDYNSQKKPVLNETYGTVADNIDRKIIQKPPKSPSLEPTKLRLPPNRDTGPLSPRMRSPIPQHHVSTEKLIATELLRTSRSPTPTKKKSNHLSSSHQRLDANADYSDSQRVAAKPPISRIIVEQKGSQSSPNYENQAAISRMANQIKPNYEYNYRISTRSERDSVSNYRNSMSPSYQSSPNYDPRTHQSSPYASSQEILLANQVPMRSPTPINLLQNAELALIKSNSRCSTPVDQRIAQSSKTPSPQKEEMRKSVEAYYWKEIKKLKEQENRDLYYYQMHLMPFGYAEDPVSYRRSRSSSPSSLRNSRRSLSLPREPKQYLSMDRHQHLSIPEGSTVSNYQNRNVQYQQNFRRNVPERRTIDSIPRSNGNTMYRPIFKRGSLTTPVREFADDPQQKRVSFNNNNSQNRQAWPTRNGYTQSPPQRRMETARQESLEDDVFLPNQQQTSKLIVDGKEVYGYANRPYDNLVQKQDPYYQNANFYKQIHQEPVYNPQLEESRIPRGITRYNSMQLVDPAYGQNQKISRRMSVDNPQNYVAKANPNAPRRQIYLKDDIYGYFGGYIPNDQQNVVYSSRQSVAEPNYGYRSPQKQVTVRDKVCDFYGQIHDRESPSLSVRKSGVVLGQLQQQAYPQPPGQNFVRNSRLTASANDMYRRHQNVEHNPRYANNVVYDGYQERPPSRPLPPVPADKNVYYRQRVNNPQEFRDVQSSNKGRGVFDFENKWYLTLKSQQKPNFPQHQPHIHNNAEKAILLEQLQLLKRQQELEINKWKHQQSQNRKSQQFHSNSSSYTNNGLSLEDLKKQVLLEELKLLRLKIKMEIISK